MSASTVRPAVASLPLQVAQLVDNAAFLWEHRERSARAHVYPATLRQLQELDERLDAHVDAIRVSGTAGVDAVYEGLQRAGTGEVFIAAATLFSRIPTGPVLDDLLAIIARHSWAIRPVAVALHWLDDVTCARAVRVLEADTAPALRAVALSTRAMRGWSTAREVRAALEADVPALARVACDAAVRMGLHAAIPAIQPHVHRSDVAMALDAAHAVALLGGVDWGDVLKTIATRTDAPAIDAAATLFRMVKPFEALQLHRELYGALPSRPSLAAIGASGSAALVPIAIECLDHPRLGKVAADAIAAVAGVEIEGTLATAMRADEGVGPSEDPNDEDTALDPLLGMPWPDASRVGDWWRDNGARFDRRARYLAGAATTDPALLSALRSGRQATRRAAAALYARRGYRWVDVTAPTFRQVLPSLEGAWA